MGWGYSRRYVTISDKREKAERRLAQLQRKDPHILPVVISGNKIAKSWWGIAWNKNMESYADLSNRISRGSTYVKNGFVLDLRIYEGEVDAQVMGSKLYKVKVTIKKLSDAKWTRIMKQCSRRIADLAELIEGRFPKELEDVFMKQGTGLFPTPKEINFICTCPDQYGKHMCKHIAATLYGIGSRLDDDPLLFFKLRGVDPSELLRASVEERTALLLKNAKKRSKRVIKDEDIGKLFGLV
jgi:uncharacterized Zn finger protein